MQTFKVTCPSCSKTFQVPGSMNGKQIQCPSCQTAMRMRFPKSAPQQPTARPQQPAQRPPVNQPRRRPAQDDFLTLSPLEDRSAPASQRQATASRPRYLNNPTATRKKKKPGTSQRTSKPKPYVENDLTMTFRGVGLFIGGIIVCLVPLGGMGSGGRSAKAKGLAFAIRAMGPFAPLAGVAMGLAGAAMIVFGLKRVPKAFSGSVAAVMVLIVLTCGGIGAAPGIKQLAATANANGSGGSSSSNSWANFFASADAKAMLKVVDEYEAAVKATLGPNPDRIPEAQISSKFQSLSSKLRQIDLSNCPKEFQSAFRKHASDWGSVGSAVSSSQNRAGIMGIGPSIGNSQFNLARSQMDLQRSWEDVKRVANKNGLEIREE